MAISSAGQAVWNQRQRLATTAERLPGLMRAVGQTVDLSLNQWMQLTAFALDFRPDLIIELGRERGNSTCCFLEAAELLRPEHDCRVVSLCLTDYWAKETRPRLEQVCSPAWFARGDILKQNLLKYDFARAIGRSQRVLLFWDAHGFDIAECVLGHVFPMLADRQSAVMLHDMSDTRYDGAPAATYGPHGLWKGARDNQGTFWLGHINSHVAQAVSVVDFTTRNRIPLHSAGEDMHREFADPAKQAEMKRLLGEEMFRLSAHWFWFSLDEAAGPVAFPPWPPLGPPPHPPVSDPTRVGLLSRVVRKCRRLGSRLKRRLLPVGNAP